MALARLLFASTGHFTHALGRSMHLRTGFHFLEELLHAWSSLLLAIPLRENCFRLDILGADFHRQELFLGKRLLLLHVGRFTEVLCRRDEHVEDKIRGVVFSTTNPRERLVGVVKSAVRITGNLFCGFYLFTHHHPERREETDAHVPSALPWLAAAAAAAGVVRRGQLYLDSAETGPRKVR
jgi:hypothetical protein